MRQSLSRWIWFPLLLLLVAPLPGQAQTQLAFNTPTDSTLASAGAQQLYAFSGQSGSAITVQIASRTNGLVLQASLFGPDGALVQQFRNDAQQPSFTGQISLSQTGQYTLLISSANNSPGTFTVTLSAAAGGSNSPAGNTSACETIISEVLNSLDTRCAGITRNQACYGNLQVAAQASASATGFTFEREGDIVNITDLQAFQLSPMNVDTNTWGLVLVRAQANLPDVLPGQNVTMLFFGDTQVINNPAFDSSAAGSNAPMQSVYFRRGISAASCGDTPDTGFVIQTPEGAGTVQLTVNEVEIELGSTLFAHVIGTDAIEFNLTEGTASISALNSTQILNAGQRVRVPVNSQILPVAPPEAPQPIDPATLERFPVDELPSNDDLNNPPDAPATTEEPNAPDTGDNRPELPQTGPCVIATFEDVTINVRERPSVDAPAVSFMQPDEVLNVRGRDQSAEWLQTSRGWVADFVVRKGGDCESLPVTYIPPTPTPTPTPTPAVPIARDGDRTIDIDYQQIGIQHTLFGELSAPEGNRTDVIRYRIINQPHSGGYQFYQTLVMIFSCDAPAGTVDVMFSDGRRAMCGGEPVTYSFTDWMDGSVTFNLMMTDEPVFATWSLTVEVRQ